MKIKTLIVALQQLEKEKGNLRVLVSSDPEGNAYCDLGNAIAVDHHKGNILIFPERTIPAYQIGL